MRYLFRSLVVLLALVAGAMVAVSWWVLRPEVLEKYVLDAVEDRTGIDIDVGTVRLGLDGILLVDVSVFEPRDPEQDEEPPRFLQVERIAVRPEWRALLSRRVVISYAAVDGLHTAIHRGADGSSNLGRLFRAFSRLEEAETAPAAPPAEPAAAVELQRIVVRESKIEYTDRHERARHPLRLALDVKSLTVRGLTDGAPSSFELDAAVTVGTDTHSTIEGTGTIGMSPVVIDTDLELSEVDVDTLVPNLSNPENDDVPGPLPLEGLRVDGRINVARVQYEGLTFTKAKAVARLDGTDLNVSSVHANIAGGKAVVTADIDFGQKGFRYTATARLADVRLAKAGGLLAPIQWGRSPNPRANIDADLSMAGTTAERLLDTISLQATVEVDTLDLDAVLDRYGPSNPRDLGPFDTGDGTMEATLTIDRMDAYPFDFTDVSARARLAKSRLTVSPLTARIAEGTLRISTDVDLAVHGLSYGGTISLADARMEPLTAGIQRRGFGTRTGVFGLEAQLQGRGTDTRTLISKIDATGHVAWTDGRVANSDYLKELADVTGIPGFRDLVVMNSGGKFRLRNGVLSTDRMRIWGPDAGIQVAGELDQDLEVNAQVALGIGPNSNRELFSTGIALPYVKGKHGWRFVPVNVTGNVYDPSMSIPPKAVLRSALTAVPAAGVGVVSTGLGAVRGGTRAVLDGTRRLLPGTAAATTESADAVDDGTGLVEGAVRGGANAVDSVFDGIGSLFDDEPAQERKP